MDNYGYYMDNNPILLITKTLIMKNISVIMFISLIIIGYYGTEYRIEANQLRTENEELSNLVDLKTDTIEAPKPYMPMALRLTVIADKTPKTKKLKLEDERLQELFEEVN